MTTPQTDLDWLSLVIWGEARGEPRDGQAAVGQVVLNRVAHRYQAGDTIESAVLHPMAFSEFWCDFVGGKYTRVAFDQDAAIARAAVFFNQAIRYPMIWAQIRQIAAQLLAGAFQGDRDFARIDDRTVLYANLSISKPVWATPENQVCVIGHHTFFTDPAVHGDAQPMKPAAADVAASSVDPAPVEQGAPTAADPAPAEASAAAHADFGQEATAAALDAQTPAETSADAATPAALA